MGINPIEYQPWTGERVGYSARVFAITETIFRERLKSKGILALLIIGTILAHMFTLMMGIMIPHEALESEMMRSYLKSELFLLFTIFLASLVCAGLVSEDLGSNSFVLYFSRPLKTESYIIGKMAGAIGIMGLYCFLPPLLIGIVMVGTQTGSDYLGSLAVLGITMVAAALITVLFVPMGMMISSFTKRRTYAAVGIFMMFFSMTLIGGIFSTFDANWQLASPINSLFYTFDLLFGASIPENINGWGIGIIMACLLIIPMIVVYIRVNFKAVGK